MSIEVAPFEDANAVYRLCGRAVDKLLEWRGQGESHGAPNNTGPQIDRWRSLVGVRPGGRGSWCSVVQGAADVTAAIELGMVLPWGVSPGARRYVRSVAASDAGVWACKAGPWPRRRLKWHISPWDIPRGSWVLWDRGDPDRRSERWKAHVERLVEFDQALNMVTVGGNRNNRSADGHRWAVVDTHKRTPGQWKRRLAGIVVPI